MFSLKLLFDLPPSTFFSRPTSLSIRRSFLFSIIQILPLFSNCFFFYFSCLHSYFFYPYLYYHYLNSCFLHCNCSLCRSPAPFFQHNYLYLSSPFLSPFQHPHPHYIFSCHYSASSRFMFILPPFCAFPPVLLPFFFLSIVDIPVFHYRTLISCDTDYSPIFPHILPPYPHLISLFLLLFLSS